MNGSVASPVFLSLSDVIRALRVAVAAWGGRGVLGAVLVHLVHRRFGEIARRLEGMAARFQAGRVLRREVRAGGVATGEVVAGRRGRAVRVWPGRFAWLVREVGWEAAGFGSQLRALLETPEVVALLVASPEAGRVLRPLCRALAIETALLRPGAVVAAPVAVVKAKRVRKPRVTLDLGRVPIPLGVMAAVRRGRFLRG